MKPGPGSTLTLMTMLCLACGDDVDPAPPRNETTPRFSLPEGAAERLAGAVRFQTLSHEDPARFDAEAFRGLHEHLRMAFPLVHIELRRELVGDLSLLYTWEGSEPSLAPILLMGHQDVVPVEHGTEQDWQQPPFEGVIDGGFVWGRGAIDNKSAVVGTLEAAEGLLREGFRPKRTVYFAFGHDEEVGGTEGARKIAELLSRRGVHLEMVLDEGGVIGEGLLPNVPPAVALVGVAEKGFLSLELTAETEGGHSSMPPRDTAIGMLSAAITRIEQKPMPPRLETPTRELFARIGPLMPFAQRMAFANLWLTEPLVLRKLVKSPSTSAMVRTTVAPTILQAGEKDNVLPSRARAVVNLRLLPGDSIAEAVEYVRDVVGDPRIEVTIVGRFTAEPSTVTWETA